MCGPHNGGRRFERRMVGLDVLRKMTRWCGRLPPERASVGRASRDVTSRQRREMREVAVVGSTWRRTCSRYME